MSLSFDISIEFSEQYDFKIESLSKIEQNTWVKNQWPLVYFIQDAENKLAYVGESTDASKRIKNHLSNPERRKLNKISIIGSDKFNKSATLDIESNLIQYITADGLYKLQNLNFGLTKHNYYQQDLYNNLFKEIWNKLIEKKIVTKSLTEIENSEIFKYSPYKSLNEDQYGSILEILNWVSESQSQKIFVSGSAGTGKTILATYLMKLLHSNLDNINLDELNDEEYKEFILVKKFQENYPDANIGLVIAMTSLRETLQNVFKKVPGLKPSMILSPSDTFKLGKKYDLLIIDESHRLRQYKNISWRGEFKKKNSLLNLGNEGTELNWILSNSKNQVFFYDSAQSVKPSDVDSEEFAKLLSDKTTKKLELKSQMRVKGGSNYISFVDQLLNVEGNLSNKYYADNYELLIFDSFQDLYNELKERDNKFKLCRLVAGYSWVWKSDPKKKPIPDKEAIDIEIEGIELQWNQTDKDWINNPKDPINPLKEVGCIHTVQGYDLNYTGIIFGKEINFNPKSQEIEIDEKSYFDKYGRIGANNHELKNYIINIYKTLMYRGIKGTFIYVVNKELREYLKEHIVTYQKPTKFRVLRTENVKPFVNSLPLLDISAAAGSFSDLQQISELTWVEPPENISPKKDQFICKVVGESMNKIIPNGSFCLFKKDEGGSREGKIVLVQHVNISDSDFGAGYTVKRYSSKKTISDDSWQHESIILYPESNDKSYSPIILMDEATIDLKVIGIFERTL